MVRPRSLLALRLVSLLATGVSMALLLDSLRPQPTFCVTGSGCDQIRKLGYGKVAGVPVPALGLGAYGSLFLLSFAPGLRALTAGAAMFGGVIGLLLLGLQAAVIQVFCKFCVVVDLSAMAAGVAGYLLRSSPEPVRDRSAIAWAGAVVAALGLPVGLAQLTPPSPVPRTVRALWKPDHVNVIEFSDFECPFCRMTHPALEAALHKATDLKVNFIRKTLPLPSHPNAREASRAYLCAEASGKGDAMADKLFTGSLSRLAINLAASELDIPLDTFRTCMEDKATEQKIEEHIAFVRGANFEGLPTVWINDQRLLGARDEAAYTTALREAAAGKKDEGGKTWPLGLVVILSLGLIAAGLSMPRDPSPAA